ncbi:murein biosynthesis integral membrane protein MurJ [Hippea maritima]|uniref:Probable lipid II flippase MurJ n=1 Tax=Hippea maritima (strain ATCC 700847 / DSM 10411 / MH2) TaxID=760142 RepID=F2LVJ9_HIPMA|nr:murein biosynthesis integral membrane protein MurJ [Hippea maritima]AEA33783.1 integral membrane protein MviN [Hippea maritima DSM 10411]
MFKNAKIIAFFTLISRILGYIRDVLIASHFGVSIYTDMFFIAFRIPNTLRRFLGEGAINSSVVPVLSRIDEDKKPLAVWNIIFVFGFVLLMVSVLGVVFSKVLVAIFAGGYLKSGYFPLMNNMVKLTFPYIFFIGLTVLFMGILNTYKHFAIPSFAPALLNISLIGFVYFSYKFSNPIYALCVGVIIGGLLQLAISLFDFTLLKIPFRFSLKIENSTKQMFSLMGITALGSGVMQISSMVDSFVASFLAPGSFSYIFYANRLFQLPFAVFSIALSQSSLPDLSSLRRDQLTKAVALLLRFVVFISVAVEMYFLFFSRELVDLLFKHGRFSGPAASNTSLTLKIMILGFLFFSVAKILSNAFYSFEDAKTPLRASIISSSVAIVASVAFGFWLGFVGLAISMSLSGLANAVVLWFYANRSIGRLRVIDVIDRLSVFEFVVLLLLSFAFSRIAFGFLFVLVFYAGFALYGFKYYSAFESK